MWREQPISPVVKFDSTVCTVVHSLMLLREEALASVVVPMRALIFTTFCEGKQKKNSSKFKKPTSTIKI